MKRLGAVLCFLLIATVAAQDRAIDKPNDETHCWGCHNPGNWPVPMDPAYDVLPLRVEAAPGETFTLEAELLNTWRAEVREAEVVLDISGAPSLRYVGTREAEAESHDRTIVVEPGPGHLPDEPFSDRFTLEVPDGATAVRLRAVPDDNDPLRGPDLELVLTNAAGEHRIDAHGAGATETFALEGAATVVEHGFGAWEVGADVTLVGDGLDPRAEDVAYTLHMDAWFNITAETHQVRLAPEIVQKGTKALFSWDLRMVAPPAGDEAVRVWANATLHYDHLPPTPPVEDWDNMTQHRDAPLEAGPDGRYAIGFDAIAVPDAAARIGTSMAAVSEAVGYAAGFLLLASIASGGIFGKASRRQLNIAFGSARRRVAFHNFLSYGIIMAALAHMTIFVIDAIEPAYPWQLGLLWGGLSILCMLGLGVTGALQVKMVRKWGYGAWRWLHFGLAIGSIVFALTHMLLDGQNFGAVQEAIGYQDPLTPA